MLDQVHVNNWVEESVFNVGVKGEGKAQDLENKHMLLFLIVVMNRTMQCVVR